MCKVLGNSQGYSGLFILGLNSSGKSHWTFGSGRVSQNLFSELLSSFLGPIHYLRLRV